MAVEKANNRQGFRLKNVFLLEGEAGDKTKIYLIRVIFETSPFLKKILSRDVNFSMRIGAKPSEIAEGLAGLSKVLKESIPDEPTAIIPVAELPTNKLKA